MSTNPIILDFYDPYLYIGNDASNSLLNRNRLYLNIGIHYDPANAINLSILNIKGKLFVSKADGKKYPLEMMPEELYLNNSNMFSFSTTINKSELDLLNRWRNNSDLFAEFTIEGLVLSIRSNNNIISKVTGTYGFPISDAVFKKEILTPSGLLSSYFREFGSVFSSIVLNSQLDEFIESIRCMHTNLGIALDLLRNSKDSTGYNRVLSQIRVPLDAVLNFRKDTNTVNLLESMLQSTNTIVTTGKLKPSSPNQKYTSAQNEIVHKLFDLIEMIHSFTSKSQHTLYKGQTSTFNMNSEVEDAEFILTLAYAVVTYIDAKVSKMSKTP
jgi:hypothetical protein